jgi:WD40 repeat protein
MIKTYGQTPKQLFQRPHPMITKNWTKGRATDDPPNVTKALDSVVGLRWGKYVGSPGQQEPKVVWRGRSIARVDKFSVLDNLEVFGLPKNSCLLVRYSADMGWSLSSPKAVSGAGLVTHAHPDDVIRVKLRKSSSPQSFRFLLPSADAVSIMSVTPEGDHAWIGFESGKLLTVAHTFNPKELTVSSHSSATALYGHSERITCLEICPQFGVAVSGSADCTANLWDVKTLAFVRSWRFDGEVSCCAVSKTSGDVVVVSSIPDDHSASDLTARTINGLPVGRQRCEPPITSVCYSSCPEGVSVNVVATGHRNGMVRLWSSWDLSPVRDVPTYQASPVVAVAFSYDNQNMYASTEGGEVVIFEKANVTGMDHSPKFVDLTGLM